ncbi:MULTISPECIES: chlorohydrolase family protein [Jonquetella]|uniref:Cytosine deaminase-like metal-dependent hydrolase n=1 Tax=Jonquetella anthropi DSM 22815 TaxID=885272 RepID=H0UKW7_9BACT|nr:MULTISPECIES: chlorohydrolase family protein [Jonquetella]EHM13326.1 cytosine deaminase-like metal-dependent hydrolase [Jonquetella anthropi DSM 22815]ERL23547.1 amidohydrolase family protein [Jonquetella sp. BV3C21]
MKTRIKARYVIGFDGHGHRIIENGQVVYEGQNILYVGAKEFPGTVDREIDCGCSLVSPGLIDLDALGDIDHGLYHWEVPSQKNASLMWSKKYWDQGPREFMTPEEEAFKSLYAYAALVRAGITTAMPITSVLYKACAETYEEIEAAAYNARDVGLRVYLGPSYQSGNRVVASDGTTSVLYDEEAGKKGLERAIRFANVYGGWADGLINAVMVPERIETQTIDNLVRSKAAAREIGCPMRLHAAQGSFEYNWIVSHHSKTPLQLLDSLGILDDRTLIPHGLFVQGFSELSNPLPGDDLALLAERKTTVIHCPLVYARGGTALESFGRYRRAGVNMAMGTDTFPCDLLLNISVGSMMARRVDKSPEGNRVADFFETATLGGARALGRDDLGRLAAGAKADIVVFDLSGRHIGPIDDPLRTLVNSGSGRDLKLSVINGRVVFENGRVLGIDESRLDERAQQYYDRMKASVAERDFRGQSLDELFAPSFPAWK